MVGPALFVYLPKPLTQDDKANIYNWLSESADLLQSSIESSSWRFWWPQIDSCEISLDIAPFGFEASGRIEMEESEQNKIISSLGYKPASSVELNNFCRSDIKGHVLLAKVAIYLASHYYGVIEIDSSIHEIDREKFPGKYYEIYYDSKTPSYLVDSTFMESWIQHPKFYLVI